MKRFQNILYVSEPSSEVMKAFHYAVNLAERNKARLTVILVLKAIPAYLNRLTPHMVRQFRLRKMEELLKRKMKRVASRIEIDGKIQEGRPYVEVIREVLVNQRDLVVKSAGDIKGKSRQFFSSTDMQLLRKCPCPVWMVKPGRKKPIAKIVAAVNFDKPGKNKQNDNLNKQILEMTLSLAHHESAELHIIHVSPSNLDHDQLAKKATLPDMGVNEESHDIDELSEKRLYELVAEAKNWVGKDIFDSVNLKTHVIKGQARFVIPEQVGTLGADLLILGTIGRSGISGFVIGNTVETILNSINCSVLTVKSDNFISPVKI